MTCLFFLKSESVAKKTLFKGSKWGIRDDVVVGGNDFEGFKTVLSNETLWTKPRAEDGIFSKRPPVAPDRFKRRVEFLKSPAIDMQNPGNKQFKKK